MARISPILTAGGHFVGLWQCSSCSSSHKGAYTSPAARLLPFYGPVQLSLCHSPVSWYLLYALETVLGDTANLLARLPVQPEFCLILPVVTKHQQNAKLKKNQPGRIRREKWSVATTWKTIYFLRVVLLLSLSFAPNEIFSQSLTLPGQIDIPEVSLIWCYSDE